VLLTLVGVVTAAWVFALVALARWLLTAIF
jgi:hypothetical protein